MGNGTGQRVSMTGVTKITARDDKSCYRSVFSCPHKWTSLRESCGNFRAVESKILTDPTTRSAYKTVNSTLIFFFHYFAHLYETDIEGKDVKLHPNELDVYIS
jgi:hypothetical protein